MSKGENIFKRKDGRWEARYIKGYELSGKIKYGYCYGKTYKEAKEKVSKYKVALVSGLPIPDKNSRHRFSYYCDMWLETRQPKIKEATFVKYQTILECHIKPQLGGSFPLRMTDGLLQTFTNSLQEYDGLAPKQLKIFWLCCDLSLSIQPSNSREYFRYWRFHIPENLRRKCGF